MLVLAGPGSGKTFVMIQRLWYLIHEKQIRPDTILVISFSKASTLELKQRFQKQSKDKTLEDLLDESMAQVNFATFHACFFHILKETYHYTSKDIITEKQKRDVLKTILSDPSYESKDVKRQENSLLCDRKESGVQQKNYFSPNKEKSIINQQKNFNYKEIENNTGQQNQFIQNEIKNITEQQKQSNQNEIKNITEKTEEYLQKISYYKNKGRKELEKKESKQFQQIFHAYNKEIHQLHKLDFDDMGLLCLQLFNTRPEILKKWQDKFQYILIDEFQDINMVQFRIIQLLVKKHQNLFVVGDDDQSIYSFRGASPQIMLDFEKYYPDTEKVLLETNYRCSKNIVKESLKVIEQNKVRFQKEIKSLEESKGKEEKNITEQSIRNKEDVIFQGFENGQKEYTYIAERIREIKSEQKYNYSDIACIFRTNQDMTGLAEYFARNKIPFGMKESCNSIFKHFIALDILAYLQFFLEGRKRKDFIRIMNKPLRYLSRNALSNKTIVWKELKQYYTTKKYMVSNIEQLEQNEAWIQKLDLYGACFYIRKVIGYEQYLKEYTKESELSWEEAKEILNFIQESTREKNSLEEWKDYIEQYEESLKNAKEEKDGVQIITMHACKGLEYPCVFLPDCNEGKIPHKKAASREEIEEERRMFYVAMTRAKYHLEILYIEDKLKKHLQPSRFLNNSLKN